MNTEELKQYLESKYTLVCFNDLANVSMTPYYVYNLFYKVHKDTFKSNERLVFYSSQTPSDNLIKHLYQAAKTIDISNFFVLIVAPNTKEILQRNRMHNTDECCFDYLDMSISNCLLLQENFYIPDTICPMPWMHSEIKNGKIKPCCVYDNESAESFANNNITEIFNGDLFQNTRHQLLQGTKIPQCSRCWNTEDLGIISSRQRHLDLWGGEFLGYYIQNPEIKSLDIKPSDACNFKCRICGPGSSSLHVAELTKKQNIIFKQSDYHLDKLFNRELPSLLAHLKNIDFYGGEPFFIKQILSFIKECTHNGHSKHLRLHFNTNGSVFPKSISNCWKHFNQIDIQFSIDDIGDRFELQRGGSWQDVENNIKQFLKLNLPNMTFGIMPAVSILNVYYLDELFKWADSLGLPIYIQLVEDPVEFSIKNLTEQAKQALLNKYKNSQHKEVQKMYDTIDNIQVNPKGAEKFKTKILYYDNMRNESFQTSHYEIAQLMGLC